MTQGSNHSSLITHSGTCQYTIDSILNKAVLFTSKGSRTGKRVNEMVKEVKRTPFEPIIEVQKKEIAKEIKNIQNM